MTQKAKLALGTAGLAVLVAAAVVGYNVLARTAALPAIELPAAGAAQRQPAVDFAMTDRDGNTVSLSQITAEGRPVVLNFWASWCPACRAEKPGFESVHRDYGDSVKFVMLALVDGARETVETATRYFESGGFTLPMYLDTAREGAAAYGIRALPTTVFIDRDGYILTGIQGMVPEDTLRQAVAFMLE